MIAEGVPFSHRMMTSPDPRHRILYVGQDLDVLKLSEDALERVDHLVVRCPPS
jgi:hypothetical protein